MKFTVRREGKFELALASGNKCGISGTHEFGYEFWFAGDSLDDRQFLVDHHEVDEAIQVWAKAAKYKGSCEQVVVAIGNIVLDYVKHDLTNRFPYLIVKLRGSFTANVQVEGRMEEFRSFSPKLEAQKRSKP